MSLVSVGLVGVTVASAPPALAAGCDKATFGGDVTALAVNENGTLLTVGGKNVCQVWFTSGTNRSWTLPPVSSIDIAVVGGGGGGGGATTGTGGAGGGGGKVTVKSGVAISPGTATITVGAGGTAGAATGTAGGAGGTTTAVLGSTTLTAGGGTGGAANNGKGGDSGSQVEGGASVAYTGGAGLNGVAAGGGGAGAGNAGMSAIAVGATVTDPIDVKRIANNQGKGAAGLAGAGLTVITPTLFKTYSTVKYTSVQDVILGGGGDPGNGTLGPRVSYPQREIVAMSGTEPTLRYYLRGSYFASAGGGGIPLTAYKDGVDGMGGGGAGGTRMNGDGSGGRGGAGGVVIRFIMPDPPGVPTITTTTPSNPQAVGKVEVNVAPGTGTAPTSYIVKYRRTGSISWLTLSPNPTSSPITMSGLAAGDYDFQVASANMIGTSAYSAIVKGTVLDVTRPAAPTPLAGNAKVTASVVLSTTGVIPTSYVIQTYKGGVKQVETCTVTAPATSCQVTGLTNGTAYTFTTTAKFNSDSSQESPQSVAATPYTVPGAPSLTSTAALDAAASVDFTAPASDGGSAITNYEYSVDGGLTWKTRSPAAVTSPIQISGLVNGKTYSVKLRAVNAAGPGPASTAMSASLPKIGPPEAPIGLVAAAGNGSASIAFTPGAENGSAITNYQYSGDGGLTWTAFSPDDSTSPVTIPGLDNETPYTFKLRAVNGYGAGAASVSVSVTPMPLPPGAPTVLSPTAGDSQAEVSFNPPTSDGGGKITNYQYSLDGGITWKTLNPADDTSPVTIPNLVNGTPYTITLRAVNASGPGASSVTSSSVTPIGPPDAPIGPVATSGNGSATIAFTPGADNGSAITKYEYSDDSGITWKSLNPLDDTTSPVTITGLTNNTSYTIELRATNGVGTGGISVPVTVTPKPQPPLAPTITTAARGDKKVDITFTAPTSDGGSAITDYEYSINGGLSWTSLAMNVAGSKTITGLANGTQYSVTLRAKNSVGSGPPSSAKTATPAGPPEDPTSLSAVPRNGALEISFTPGSDNGSPITKYSYLLKVTSGGSYPSFGTDLDDTTSPVTISGLTNGTNYTIELFAWNAMGPSRATANGVTVVTGTPYAPPAAPTIFDDTPGVSQAEISFTPGNNGGSAITNYQYSIDGGAWIAVSPADTTSPVTVTGLKKNTTAYKVKLRAVNAAGDGAASNEWSTTITLDAADKVPGPPTILDDTASDRSAIIAVTVDDTGGQPITNYEYCLDTCTSWTAFSPDDSTSPVTITGLNNGQTYSIKLRAVNVIGPGAESAPLSVTPAVVPAAPTGLTATAGSKSAVVAFTAGYNGGSPITNYKYCLSDCASPGSWTALSPDDSTAPVTIPGLTNETQYTIELRAVNAIGDSLDSDPVTVTPKALPPAAPTGLIGTGDDTKATISFTPPLSDDTITNYEYSLDGGVTWTALNPADGTSPVTITNLVNGTPYPISLRAVVGSVKGAASSSVSVTPVGPPAAPVSLVATPSNGSAQIAFTPGSDGGSPITNYKYQVGTGPWTALSPADTTSPVTIPGLVNGTTYTITLLAVNDVGDGAESLPVTVTPQPLPPSAPISLSAVRGDRQATVSFTPPASDGGGAISNYQYSVDGGVTWTALSPTDDSSPVTIPNLVNGTPYEILLRAVNVTGPGAASLPASAVTPAGPPGPPTSLVATPGDTTAEIDFFPGTSNGSPITKYQYSLNGGQWTDFNPDDSTSPVTISGLTNGTAYTITLRAVNGTVPGESVASEPVVVTPAKPASAPVITGAIGLDDAAELTFDPPSSNGGATITNYQYCLTNCQQDDSWISLSPADGASPVMIPGLKNGVPSTIILRAVTAVGAGAQSNSWTVTPVAAPAAPTALVASPESGKATITFTPGPDNGSVITEYLYSLDDSTWTAVSATSSPVTVTGLTNGTAYTVRLRAKNGVGVGTISLPVSVTPNVPPVPDPGPGPGPTPPGPTPTPTPTPAPVPIPAPLDPGDSALAVDGKATPVTVRPNRGDDGLNVKGDGWTMDLDGLGPDGKPLDLGPTGVLRVQVGGDVQTEGTGFKPDSEVGLFLNPPVEPSKQSSTATWFSGLIVRVTSGIPVGMVRVNAQGSFVGTAELPRDIKPGKHVLQAVGFGPGGETRALSLGVLVEASIVLDRGVRTKGAGRIHDRINTTGSTTGIEPGTRLTPYIKYAGQKTFTEGKASIVVAADGSFRWTRQIRRDKAVTGYVAYLDARSNEVTWFKVK